MPYDVRRTLSRLRSSASAAACRALAGLVRSVAHRLSPDTLVRLPVPDVVEVWPPPGTGPPVLLGRAGSDRVASLVYWRGLDGWEPETIDVFLRLVRPRSVVVDVGANSGLFSLLTARCQPEARIHAIEPVDRVFSLLESNVVRNRLTNVKCHRLALGEVAGTLPMYVPAEEPVPVMASLVAGWSGAVERQEVRCQTLDGFVASLAPGPVDVVKLDAEGGEDAVLRGGASVLRTHRPFIVCEVLRRGGLAAAVTAALAGHGYRFFALGSGRPRPVATINGGIDDDETHNYLFAPEDRLAELEAALARQRPGPVGAARHRLPRISGPRTSRPTGKGRRPRGA